MGQAVTSAQLWYLTLVAGLRNRATVLIPVRSGMTTAALVPLMLAIQPAKKRVIR